MKNHQYEQAAPVQGQQPSEITGEVQPDTALTLRNIARCFEWQVQQRLEQVALQSLDGNLTYHELNARANQVAHFLKARGVSTDTTVGVCLEHNISMVIGILAVLKAGGCYLPLDPAYPQERLQLMLEQSGCQLVLSEAALFEELEVLSEVPTYPLDGSYFQALYASQPDTNPEQEVFADSLAYIIYTSGSTGTPKGTSVTHANVLSLIDSGIAGLGPQKGVLCAASPSFDAFTFELWGALLNGGRCVLVSLRQLDLQQLKAAIEQFQVNTAWLTAAVFNQIVTTIPDVLATLHTLLIGGEALSKPHVLRAMELFPQLCLLNGYGPTECTTFTCIDSIDISQVNTLTSVPIGHAIRHAEVYILNEQGEQVQDYITGELYIGGNGVCRGYYEQPALTAECFIPNPFSQNPGQRLYRTGDLVRRLADGKIEYLGRSDNQVKIRGFRIELNEIENALVEHPAVCQAVVKAWQRSSGDKYLTAYLVLQHSDTDDGLHQQILLYLQNRLPAYMVPLACIILPELPLTLNGKVDRYALPSVDEAKLLSTAYEAPASPLESQLLELFRQNLGIQQLGVTDSYLALGGDSIKAIALITEARRLGIKLSIRQLFVSPTVRELAMLSDSDQQNTEVTTAGEDLAPFALLNESEMAGILQHWPAGHVSDAYPLSQVQQGMVYHALQHEEHSVYHDIVTYRLSILPKQTTFQQALQQLQKKHPVLRSVFQFDQGRPLQIVLQQHQLKWSWYDIQDKPDSEQQEIIRHWVAQEKVSSINPTTELLRIAVFVLEEQQVQLALSFHHAMWDGWSDAVFVKELVSLCNQSAVSLQSPPGYQYAIAAELAAMADPHLQQYWRDKLIDVRLPWWSYSTKAASVQLDCEIPPEICQRIMQLATELQVQEKSVWASIYLVLLSLLDGHSDVAGTVVSHSRPEMVDAEHTLGLFLNPLPVRAHLSGQNWQQFIGQVHTELVALYPVRQFPLAAIQRQSGLDFSASLFNYINFHVHQDNSTDVLIRHDLGFVETNYLFAMNVRKQEDGHGYAVQISADSVIFNQKLCERLQQYLQNIMLSLAQDLLTPINRQNLLGQQELSLLLNEWSGGGHQPVSASNDFLAHELFEQQAQLTPYAVAVAGVDNHLTYQALNIRANRLAEYLLAVRSGPEARIGIWMPRSVEMAIALLGIMKAGCTYVPLSTTDPVQRVELLLQDAGIEVLLTFTGQTEKLPDKERYEAAGLKLLYLDVFEQQSPSRYYPNPLRQDNLLQNQNLAYILFTSGTSGVPKGVMVQHDSFVNHCRVTTQMRGFDQTTRNLQFAPLVFDAASAEFFNAFISGSLLHLPPQDVLADHQSFEQYVWLRGVNRGYIPPAYLKLLNKEHFRRYVSISVGGEAVARETLADWVDLCPITNAYGPTECTIAATSGICNDRKVVSIGTSLPGVKVYVVDEDLYLLPPGVAGELCIGGIGVSRGYLNNSGLTAAKFVPDPFSPHSGSRLYRTGDKVKWLEDGQLAFLGRLDQQIKLRGQRIEISEIEQCLLGLDLVNAAAVVLQHSDQANTRLVAFVVPRDTEMSGSSLIRRLKAGLRHQLPAYMVPDAFGVLTALPLTVNGKINREVLVKTMTEFCLDDLIEPVGSLEQAIAEIWCELLQLDSVGRHSNFFELGGHSLLATQLFARLRNQLHVDLSFRRFFASPTIAELAEAITQQAALPSATPELIPLTEQEKPYLSFAQQRLWFLNQFTGPDATYNIPLALRLTGVLDVGVLQQSLTELLTRHETLRSRIANVRGAPELQIVAVQPLWLQVEQVGNQADLIQICEQEQQHEFDLASEDLIRFRLLQQGNEQYLLLITMHHIVADGWSMAIFFRELTTLYQAFRQGLPSPLPRLPIRYTDYACWQQQWFNAEQQQLQLNYWKQQLIQLSSLLQLPTDRPRPQSQSYQGRSENFRLSAQLSTQLRQLSESQDVTLFVTLLSAFSLLLHKYARQDDFAIGVPVANRLTRETEDLIGFFVNTLVMRFDYTELHSFTDLLWQTRNTALDAFEHQDIPFEQLVSELNPRRELSHAPLFQVMFALQNTPATAITLPELKVQQVKTHEFGVSRYDLTLYMSEDDNGLSGTVEYSTDLFEPSSIQLLVQQFTHLLSVLAVQPGMLLHAPLLMSGTMQQHQQQLWNGKPATPESRLEHQIHELAHARPEAPAVIDGKRVLSFAELDTQTGQLASALAQVKPDKGLRIGLCLRDPLQAATAMLAVLRLGGCYCMLPVDSGPFMRDMSFKRLKLDLLLTSEPASGINTGDTRVLTLAQLPLAGAIPDWQVSSDRNALACVSLSAGCTEFSHQQLAQLRELPESCLLPLWGLDLFSAECWWSWLNGMAVDASKLIYGDNLHHLNAVEEIPIMPAGLSARVIADGQSVATGCTGELHVAITNTGFAETDPAWRATDIWVRANPDGSFTPLGSATIWREQYQRNCQSRILQHYFRQQWPQQDIQLLWGGTKDREELLCISNDAQMDLATIRNRLKQLTPALLLPQYLLHRDLLPLGKDGMPDLSDWQSSQPTPLYQPPQGETEVLLAGIWADVLRLEQIGREQNFFELGGYSLLVTQVAARISEVFGLVISVKALFEHQTLHKQAELIEQLQAAGGGTRLSSIHRSTDPTPAPLSFAQQRLWFLSQLMGPSAVYNIPLVLSLEGELDIAALGFCLQTLIVRHESLQTRFLVNDGQVVQVSSGGDNFQLGIESINTTAELQQVCKEERDYTFDLAAEALCRIRLLQHTPQQHYLLITMHHIISDGWSTDLLLKELQQLYRAFRQGLPSPLPPLPISYTDYARWQRQVFDAELEAKQIAYWRHQLAGLPPLLELPTDFVRPAEQRFCGTVQKIELGAPLSAGLKALSQRTGTTLFMTLLAAFSILLSRYSRQTDLAIGTPVANRVQRETEGIIGFFLNSLVIRFDLSGNLTFEQYLQQVRETTLQAYQHQDLPFEQLVEVLNPQRSLSHSPLFQVSFSLLNNPVEKVQAEDLKLKVLLPEEGEPGVSRYDITFNLVERPDGIVGAMEYNTELFSVHTITRMQQQYIALLTAIVEQPQLPLDVYDMLSMDDRALLLQQNNETAAAYPQDICVHQLFLHQVLRTPDAVAVTGSQGHLTYRQLDERSNQLAHCLRRMGVGPEVCVGICCEPSIDMVVGFLAVLKAGGFYLVLDPDYPAARLEYMIEQSNCQLILTERSLTESLELLQERQTLLLESELHQVLYGRFPADGIVFSGVNASNLAYMIYTSGSTGKPKGVMISHQNITSLVSSGNAVQPVATDVVAQASNPAFDAITYEMWGALLNGARLLLIDKATLLAPALLAETLLREQVTILFITTAMFNRINQDTPMAFSSLRQLLFGGEAFSAQAIETALTIGRPEQLHHVYGPTECTTYATNYLLTEDVFKQNRKAPIGLPLTNKTAYVLNGYQLAAVGTLGELCIGGAGLSRGYLAAAALTAEKFVPNPFGKQAGERLYRTGDLVRVLADGNIEFIGRLDHQVKIRGFRIELGEIEAALAQHPAVKEVIVIVKQTQTDDRYLVAYLVPQNKSTDHNQFRMELSAYLQHKMPDYAVPRAMIVLRDLPLNHNGKVDRNALPEPEESTFARARYVAPDSAVEQLLVEVWQKVLGVHDIGVEDNFFAVGGDSIRSISIVTECRALGIQLSVKDLFIHPTIRALALGIDWQDTGSGNTEQLSEAFSLLSAEESQALLNDIAAEDFEL